MDQMPENEIRAMCFFALVANILGLILINRSFYPSLITSLIHPDRALLSILALVLGALTLTLAINPIADLFKFGPLHLDDIAIIISASISLVLGLEAFKKWQMHQTQNSTAP